MRSVFACALLAASALAVNQATLSNDQVSAAAPADLDFGTKTTTEGYGGQTKTAYSYDLENLDQVQEEILGFYQEEAKPFIEKHRSQVYEAALAEAEQKYGVLLETCDEGTKCREDILASMKSSMSAQWATILTEFKKNVEGAVSQTRTIVSDGWEALVQCEIDHDCCSYSATEWSNNQINIKKYNGLIQGAHDKWFEFEQRRIELEQECPDVKFPSCPSSEMGPCWDGADRKADCSCAIRQVVA
jgi:hypothetical protein